MAQVHNVLERRTSADVVFDHLYNEIITLGLLPGTKISEVEIANQFDVSRQPVRDAFSRLGNLDLLLIRPQKATVVKKFSNRSILSARFTRTAVEVEVLHRACQGRDKKFDARIEKNLAQQQAAIDVVDTDRFHRLDYEFHRLLCEAARCGFAFQTIADNKAQVDRLCLLSLADNTDMQALYDDHIDVFSGVKDGDIDKVSQAIRRHLGRLDGTVETIRQAHLEYFED